MTLNEIIEFAKAHPATPIYHRYFLAGQYLTYIPDSGFVDEEGIEYSDSDMEEWNNVVGLSDGWSQTPL